MYHFTINEAEKHPKPNVLHHRRRFWNGKRHDGHVETIIVRPEARFAWTFHVGNAGSETPFDGHVILFGSGLYWGVSWGRNLAQRITTSAEHKYDGRDLGVQIHDGKLWVSAWIPRDRWKRGEFARWRNVSFALNPVEWFLGPKRFSYVDVETADVELEMPEGKYPVTLKLQSSTLQRTKGGRVLRRELVVDVSADKGVPTEPDSWKGGSSYGWGVKVSDRRDWVREATLAAEAWVSSQRARRGFRPERDVPEPSDAGSADA
jgi:hypothetical protein